MEGRDADNAPGSREWRPAPSPAPSFQDGVESLVGPGREVPMGRRQMIEPSIQANDGNGNVAQRGEISRQVADVRPAPILVA